MVPVVAALFVESMGPYAGQPGVDLWDEIRDARKYSGAAPVVAHPPCARWCRLAKQMESMHGYSVGDDDGCFESALANVRRVGGVLEHPAFSLAWPRFGLAYPTVFGWQRCIDGSWVASVNQSSYGHLAQKPTWLYAVGIEPSALDVSVVEVEFTVGTTRGRRRKPELGKGRFRAATPPRFRDYLLGLARSVYPAKQIFTACDIRHFGEAKIN